MCKNIKYISFFFIVIYLIILNYAVPYLDFGETNTGTFYK